MLIVAVIEFSMIHVQKVGYKCIFLVLCLVPADCLPVPAGRPLVPYDNPLDLPGNALVAQFGGLPLACEDSFVVLLAVLNYP